MIRSRKRLFARCMATTAWRLHCYGVYVYRQFADGVFLVLLVCRGGFHKISLCFPWHSFFVFLLIMYYLLFLFKFSLVFKNGIFHILISFTCFEFLYLHRDLRHIRAFILILFDNRTTRFLIYFLHFMLTFKYRYFSESARSAWSITEWKAH